MPSLSEVHNALIQSGLAVVSVREVEEGYQFDFEGEPTGEQLTQAQAIAASVTEQVKLNWSGLLGALQGSAVLGKCYLAAQQSPAVGAALNMVVTSLIGTRDLNNLEWAIGELRTALGEADFTPEELAWVNGQLSANGFSLTLS